MAVTKIWTINDSLQRVLDYAANPDKTEYDALAQTLHYAENDAKTKLNESAQLVTGMHRLYLYYCYQLGILPKKQQPRINRPELERIWKDTEKILAEHAFVHDHKFPSLQAIVDYRKSLSQQMETLAAQRAEIVKQMRRKDVPSELADRRAMLTCKIAELRKEDRIAEGAIKRIQRTRESNRIDRENQEHHTNHNRRRNRSRQR